MVLNYGQALGHSVLSPERLQSLVQHTEDTVARRPDTPRDGEVVVCGLGFLWPGLAGWPQAPPPSYARKFRRAKWGGHTQDFLGPQRSLSGHGRRLSCSGCAPLPL